MEADTYAECYGRTEINQDAFPVLTDILARIQRKEGRLGAQQDWLNEICPPDPVSFQYESKATQATEDLARAREARDLLNVANRALSQLAECISHQAVVCEEYVKATQLRNGMSSLPDEILADILEDAVKKRAGDLEGNGNFDEIQIRTVKAAIKMSHSCQRFRQLISRIPSLWNQISSEMPLGMVSACCDRLTTDTAVVSVALRSEEKQPHRVADFIRLATKASNLWQYYGYRHSWRESELSANILEDLAKVTYGQGAPSLTKLSICYPDYATKLTELEAGRREDAVHYYSSWLMPRLLSLEATNIIPVPFTGSASLRSLCISMEHESYGDGQFNLQIFITFLASCVALEELVVKLSRVNDIFRSPSTPEKHVRFDRVIKVEFSFFTSNSDVIKLMMNALHFPVVSSMKLNIEIDYWNVDPELQDRNIGNILFSVFPDASTFPNLMDLHLDFHVEITEDKLPPQISLPFRSFSKIKHLRLIMLGSVLAPVPAGSCLPSLLSLSLQSCYKLEADWISSLLNRLKVQDNFKPSQLEVRGCYWTKSPVGVTSEEADASGEEETPRYVEVTADEMRQLIL